MTLITPILNSIAIQKSPEVFHAKNWGLNWGNYLVDELKLVAFESPLKKSRLCLHPNIGDSHQEMLIVQHKNSKERPQRRFPGFDTKIVIEGEAIFRYYSLQGLVKKEINLGINYDTYLHTRNEDFHNLEVTTEWFVFLEILNGPFTLTTTIFADFDLEGGGSVE